jgi:Cytochrome P450
MSPRASVLSTSISLTFSRYIVDTNASLLSDSLHQALIGLLSNYQVALSAQEELDTLVHGTDALSLTDLSGLPVLPAIVTESMRLSLLNNPPDVWHLVARDTWYKSHFFPRNTLLILDRDNPFPSELSDSKVPSLNPV